jgi:hypothetical protein
MLSFRAQIELQVQEGARASFGRGNLTSISGMKRKEERVNFHPRADDDLFRDVTWEEVSNGCLLETYTLHPFVAFGITTKKKMATLVSLQESAALNAIFHILWGAIARFREDALLSSGRSSARSSRSCWRSARPWCESAVAAVSF